MKVLSTWKYIEDFDSENLTKSKFAMATSIGQGFDMPLIANVNKSYTETY